MRQKLKRLSLTIAALAAIAGVASPLVGSATALSKADASSCASGAVQPSKDSDGNVRKDSDQNIIYECVPLGGASNDCKTAAGCLQQTPFASDLQKIVNALGVGVGVIVTGMIIVGGIQYIVAGDNSSQVEASKKRITNAIFALVAFFLTYAFLQWLIPGGIF